MSHHTLPQHPESPPPDLAPTRPASVIVYTAADAARRLPDWEPDRPWTLAARARLNTIAREIGSYRSGLAPLTIVYEDGGAILGVRAFDAGLFGFTAPPVLVHRAPATHGVVLELATHLSETTSPAALLRTLAAYNPAATVVALDTPAEPVVETRAGNPQSIIANILATYTDGTCEHTQARGPVRPPQPAEVEKVIAGFFPLLFPGYRGPLMGARGFESFVCRRVSALQHRLTRLVRRALAFYISVAAPVKWTSHRRVAERTAADLFAALPGIRRQLDADVRAAYRNDPALANGDHHLAPLAYPGLYATAVYRLAHFLHRQGVPYLPRIASELAHSRTGIDIHPGAMIGSGFFIDHGTGVVIGETAVIGDDVTLYQGVTLGAINFPHDEDGNLIRGAKRHPTIHSGTTIYANAAVLGPITIGRDSQVGANVSLSKPVEPESIVLIPPELRELAIFCAAQSRTTSQAARTGELAATDGPSSAFSDYPHTAP